MEIYSTSILGLLLTCLVPIVLVNVVGPAKGMAGVIAGPVADARDENFLFRLDRAHVNSVEAIPVFVGASILAMMVGLSPGYLAAAVWIFLAARVAHSLVYLRGGSAAKGGKLRTYLHVLGSLATIAVIVPAAIAAL